MDAVLAALLWLVPAAQPAAPRQEPALLARGYRTRALAASAGHSWNFGWNDASLATSTLQFAGFHPQLGWFQTSKLELYGEATVHVYWKPEADVFAGVMGIGARYHFFDERTWTPYALGSLGLGWTSLDIVEIDRVFNFQVVYGVGVRQLTRKGPGLMLEFRNHHISNAGTAGENIGINSAVILAGVHWILR